MMRTGVTVFGFGSLFLLLLISLAWTEAQGFTSADVTQLWARSILQVDGPLHFRSTDAFYPPIPFFLSLSFYGILGSADVPGPFIISAFAGAALLVLWSFSLRDRGDWAFWTRLCAVALLGLNPVFLRTVAEGPEKVLSLLGIWIFTRGLVNLRLTGNAPDMMKVAVGLILVAMSDSFGLVLAFAALPFMIVAAQPSMIAWSSTGYLVAMVYPIAVAIGSLFFTSMIFDSVLVPNLFEPSPPLGWSAHLWNLSALVPLALIASLPSIATPRVFMPLMAAVGTVCGAYALNLFFQMESDPAMAVAPLLAVTMAAIRFWPAFPARAPLLLGLLGVAFVTSFVALRESRHDQTMGWMAAVAGSHPPGLSPTEEVGRFLEGKSDIMVDIERSPEILLEMGGIESLVVSGERRYDWVLQGGAPEASYILVPNQEPGKQVTDRLLRRFPGMDQGSLPDYREVFSNARWRVFERQDRVGQGR